MEVMALVKDRVDCVERELAVIRSALHQKTADLVEALLEIQELKTERMLQGQQIRDLEATLQARDAMISELFDAA